VLRDEDGASSFGVQDLARAVHEQAELGVGDDVRRHEVDGAVDGAEQQPAAERLASRLSQVPMREPSIPVIHNVDVASHASPDAIRAALAQQAASPVRWTETMQSLVARGVTHVVECGPGKVLAGTVKRIDAEAVSGALFDPPSLVDAKALLA